MFVRKSDGGRVIENIIAKNIYGKNIFAKIFPAKKLLEKIFLKKTFSSKIFSKKILMPNIFFKKKVRTKSPLLPAGFIYILHHKDEDVPKRWFLLQF